jgi:hypothetical protein
MKNFFIAILLLFSVTSKANNNDEGITPVVLKSFHSSFKDAKEQRWTKVMDYYKVEFKLEGQDFTAYYGYEGEMIYLSKTVSYAQLPSGLKTGFAHDYSRYVVAGLIEISDDNGSCFYLLAESENRKLVLKSRGNSWIEYQKLIR